MRTMLISLILFCSLTQFAIADDGPPAPAAPTFDKHDALKDCGDHTAIYYCFVPAICVEQGQTRKPVTEGGVKNVDENMPVFSDCPAIIRFHQYTEKWVHVSIQSLQYTSEIKSIKFTQDRKTDPKGIFNEFTCLFDETDPDKKNHKQKGKYFTNPKYEEDLDQEESAEKLHCTFAVKVKRAKLFDGGYADLAWFEVVNGAETKATKANFKVKIEDRPRCDPNKIEFNNEDGKHLKMYDKVLYKPGAYYCANPDYQIEYRKEPGQDNSLYGPAEIKCNSAEYNVNNEDIEVGKTVDARCAAEAKYFCDYDVKTNGVSGPFLTKPDKAAGVASVLECKSPNTYLIIVEASNTTLVNPKFECLYLGGSEPVWIVSQNEVSVTLTKDGPLVYCTNKLECKFRISEGAVFKGSLGPDHRPKCQKTGKLFVSDIEVKNTKCDETTGQLKYIFDGGEHVIDEQTKFECKYPEVVDKQKDKENMEEIASKAVGISIGFVLFIGLIVAGCFIWACIRMRKEVKKNEAMNRAAFLKYCASPDERLAEKMRILKEKAKEKKKNKNNKDQKDKKQSQSSENEPAQYWSWNSMIMFWQHKSLCNLLKDYASGNPETERFQSKPIIMMPTLKDKKVVEEKVLPEHKLKQMTKTLRSISTTAAIGSCPDNFEGAINVERQLRTKRREAATKQKNEKAKKK